MSFWLREIFGWLDELEAATRAAGRRAVETLAAERGEPATPWNLRYWSAGDVTRVQMTNPPGSGSPAATPWQNGTAPLPPAERAHGGR